MNACEVVTRVVPLPERQMTPRRGVEISQRVWPAFLLLQSLYTSVLLLRHCASNELVKQQVGEKAHHVAVGAKTEDD